MIHNQELHSLTLNESHSLLLNLSLHLLLLMLPFGVPLTVETGFGLLSSRNSAKL